MFAPSLTRSQTDAAENRTNKIALRSPTSKLTRHMQGGDRQDDSVCANSFAPRANPHLSSDFTKIPVFPPRRELPIGRVDDPLEHEADRIADEVMRMSVSRIPDTAATPRADSDFIARETSSKATPSTGTMASEAPDIVHEVLRAPGKPLDEATRAVFEPRLGHDFSRVRVHADGEAAKSARRLGARAYTVGHKIVFGAGRFAPEAHEGRRLIAHELAHVVQQASSPMSPTLMRAPTDVKPPVPKPGQTPRNFEGALMMTVELPLGSGTPGRLGFEKDFHGYLPSFVVEDKSRWHASHAVGPIVGVELEEGILLAPRGVNLSVEKNLENHINKIREGVPKGSKLVLKIETRAHAGTRRLDFINYEFWVHGPDGSSIALTASVNVSNDRDTPRVDVSVGRSPEAQASRRYGDAFNIRKQTTSLSEADKARPLRPKSPNPATYSATASRVKRYEVPTPEVTSRRPQPVPPGGTSSGSTAATPTPATVPGGGMKTPQAAPGIAGEPAKAPLTVGSQGQRTYGASPSRPVVPLGAVAMALEMVMAKLEEIAKEVQNRDARTKLLSTRQEIIDVLHREPGVGAVIELQFLEPEHRFVDVDWRRTTERKAGKPTPVAIPEARQPTSTFIYVEPMRQARPSEAAPAAAAPKEVNNAGEFIATYMRARGAELGGVGTIAVEMYDALQRGTGQFGYTDIHAGIEVIRITDAVRASVEPAVASLAEKVARSRLAKLKGGIDAQQTRLSEKMKDWLDGAIELTGHELDRARAHYAAAENYIKDKKFGPAVESINAAETQVEEVWAALYEYEKGHRPIAPPI